MTTRYSANIARTRAELFLAEKNVQIREESEPLVSITPFSRLCIDLRRVWNGEIRRKNT